MPYYIIIVMKVEGTGTKVSVLFRTPTSTFSGMEGSTYTTMDKKATPVISASELKFVSDTTKSVAARIKFLNDAAFSRADIARIMSAHSGKSVSYQWVKNVLDKVATAPTTPPQA